VLSPPAIFSNAIAIPRTRRYLFICDVQANDYDFSERDHGKITIRQRSCITTAPTRQDYLIMHVNTVRRDYRSRNIPSIVFSSWKIVREDIAGNLTF